jgi:hypothetical protein
LFKDASNFFLGSPGCAFLNDLLPGKINLSFLHLVGGSRGIKFLIKSPVSGMAKLNLRMMMERGAQEFVRQYLTFGKVVLRVSSYDV